MTDVSGIYEPVTYDRGGNVVLGQKYSAAAQAEMDANTRAAEARLAAVEELNRATLAGVELEVRRTQNRLNAEAEAAYNYDAAAERATSAANMAQWQRERPDLFVGPTAETDANVLIYLASDAYRRGENMTFADPNRYDAAREPDYNLFNKFTESLASFIARWNAGDRTASPPTPTRPAIQERPEMVLTAGLPYGGYTGALPAGFRPGVATSNLTGTQIGQIGGVLSGLPGIVGTIGEVASILWPGDTSGAADPRGNVGNLTSCPPGYYKSGDGSCLQEGIGGTVARILPGGSSGQLTGTYGPAVQGMFGVPALTPAQMTMPTLRCPAGTVLGRDNLCYHRSSIPRNLRKWRPDPRPLLSAADGKILRRAAGLEKKLKRVSGQFIKKPRVITRKGKRK